MKRIITLIILFIFILVSPAQAGGKVPYEIVIQTTGRALGVDPRLIKAVIYAESRFDPRAVSRRGAMGLMQLMPQTARELGVRDPFSPVQNIVGGTRYLRMQLKTFGDLRLALAAYNAGPATIVKGRVPNTRETRDYVERVVFFYNYFQFAEQRHATREGGRYASR